MRNRETRDEGRETRDDGRRARDEEGRQYIWEELQEMRKQR